MKRNLLPALATAILLLGACSTNKLAQQSTTDDVYYSQAKAKEVDYTSQGSPNYRTDEQLYGGGDYRNDDDYDYDFDYGYAARLNRFYYGSPYRSYYDSWYTYSYDPWYSSWYSPYGYYDSWAYSPGVSLWLGLGNFGGSMWGYNPWGYYGYGYPSYYGNYWGPISYYGYGGYYGGATTIRTTRSKPYLGSGNPNYGRDRSVGGMTSRTGMGIGYPSSIGTRSSRPTGSAAPSTSGRTSSTPAGRNSEPVSRPSRPSRAERPSYEPDRTRTQRAYPSYNPPSQSSSPRSSGGSYGGGNSGGGSSSRPSRGSR